MTSPLPADGDREELARIIGEAESLSDDEGAWALPEDIADAILAAGFRRSVVSTPSDEVRALLDEQIRFPDSTLRMHRHGGYVQAMSDYEIALAAALEASAVSAPPTTPCGLCGVDVAHVEAPATAHAPAAPPTITDEAASAFLNALHTAEDVYVQDQGEGVIIDGWVSSQQLLSALRAALGGEGIPRTEGSTR